MPMSDHPVRQPIRESVTALLRLMEKSDGWSRDCHPEVSVLVRGSVRVARGNNPDLPPHVTVCFWPPSQS